MKDCLRAAALVAMLEAGVLAPVAAQAGAAEETIRRLATRPEVAAAFAAIDSLHDRTLQDHITLTEIPAPPFAEERRGAHFATMLREAGADSVWTDQEGNVLALRRGTTRDRTLVLSAHLDTVFPEGTDVTVRVAGDTLYAPGVGDDTRGLVVVLTVLRALEDAGIQTPADLLFVGTVGEEGLGDLRGVKHLFRDGGPPIDAFISVDGSDPGRIVHQALGSHRYRVTVHGPGGHSWGAFGLANPHHALAAAVTRFVATADGYTRAAPRTSYNVGRIGGGTSVNSIPFESWMEVDLRSVSPDALLGIDSLLHQSVRLGVDHQNALRRSGPELSATLDLIGDRPSGSIPQDHPFSARWPRPGISDSSPRSSAPPPTPISRSAAVSPL